jgi:hypothetical protein
MTPKSRGLIAINPRVKLKKKDLHKDPTAKCQQFRGQIRNIHFR